MADEPVVEPVVADPVPPAAPPADPPADPPATPAADPPADPPAKPSPAADDIVTLAETKAVDDPAQVIPATWPENWRNLLAGNNEADLKTLGRWKDPSNVWKQNKALRAKMDSGEYMRAKPDTEDAEVLTAWRKEVGVPETPEGYAEDLGIEPAEADAPYIEEYFKNMHDLGAPPDMVKRGLRVYYEAQEKIAAEQEDAHKQRRSDAEDALRGEWGPEYRPNLNEMHTVFDAHAPEGLRERLFSASFADGTRLGDDPDTLSFLVGLAKEINPQGTVTPNLGQTHKETVAKEISALEAEMADTKAKGGVDSYWQNETKQARYRQLLEVRDKMTARG